MDLNHKTALITGAASGIGRELGRQLVQKGVRVYSFDLQKPKEAVTGVTYIKVDVTRPAEIKQGLGQVDGPIDILDNNAGVMRRGTIFKSSEQDFDLLFDVMVKGSWLLTKLARPYLAQNAALVFMSSRHGLYPKVDPALYSLAKQSIINLAALTQKTYPNYAVKLVCPGPIDTPLARFGVTAQALKKKEKIMQPPSFLAAKIVEMLERDYQKLLYNPQTNSYAFE